jgi:hypothetical protein
VDKKAATDSRKTRARPKICMNLYENRYNLEKKEDMEKLLCKKIADLY